MLGWLIGFDVHFLLVDTQKWVMFYTTMDRISVSKCNYSMGGLLYPLGSFSVGCVRKETFQ